MIINKYFCSIYIIIKVIFILHLITFSFKKKTNLKIVTLYGSFSNKLTVFKFSGMWSEYLLQLSSISKILA